MYDLALSAIKHYGMPVNHRALARAFQAAKSGFVDGDIYPTGIGVTATILPGDRVAIRDNMGGEVVFPLSELSARGVVDLVVARAIASYCWIIT